MEIIKVYKTQDGRYFERQKGALAYCENKIGEEIDGLLKTCDIGLREKMRIVKAVLEKPDQMALVAYWVDEYKTAKEMQNG